MRHVMTRAQSIKYAIWIILAFVIITIFPLRLWHEKIESSGNEHPAGDMAVSVDNSVMQEFVPEYDHVDSIGVYLEGEYFTDGIVLRVFDKNYILLREIKTNTDELYSVDNKTYKAGSENGYADVYINLDVNVGENYFYSIEGVTTDLQIPYEMTGNSGMNIHGMMQYAGEVKPGYNVITRYTYEQPLRKGISLLLIVILGAVGIGVGLLMDYLYKKIPALDQLVTMRWIVRIIGNPLVVIAAIFGIICVGPLHMFSIYVADLVFMSVGIILLAGVLLYLINHDDSAERMDFFDYIKENWQNLLQAVCIALALWACITYVNAFAEVFHDSAWRKMAFFLGLGLLVTFSRKELFNWCNLALLVVGVGVARVYFVKNLPDMVDEYHTDAMMWTCRLIPMILLLIAYVIRSIIQAVKTKNNPLRMVSWPYTIVTIALATAMIVRRNTRYWPVMMTVIACFIAARFLFWENRKAFLNNIINGILIHFGACVLFCLWHRPYEAYRYMRYPFVFHTVTVTAEYMSLVMAAAIVKLFNKYKATQNIKACIGETFVLGTVASYTLFTMSRTGMIAVVAMGLVMWIAYSFGKGFQRIKSLLTTAAIVIASVIVCLPIFFTLQKAIPAVVGEPKLMMIEVYPQTLLLSKEWDSDEYITITHFAKIFGHKMIGLDEDRIKWDKYTIYGVQDDLYLSPDEVYEKTHGTEESGKATEIDAPQMGVLLSEESSEVAGGLADSVEKSAGGAPHFEWDPDDGECPPEWYDDEYWVYRPKEDTWMFAEWKLEAEQNYDVSNGRMDIYRAYYEQLTPEGHEGMGAILESGEEAAHAHDIYLQVAFDHGIIVGVLFIIWVIMTCIQALIVFVRTRKSDPAAGMALAVSITYAVAGITEWVSHPCNPIGMIALLVVVPMALYKYGKAE